MNTVRVQSRSTSCSELTKNSWIRVAFLLTSIVKQSHGIPLYLQTILVCSILGLQIQCNLFVVIQSVPLMIYTIELYLCTVPCFVMSKQNSTRLDCFSKLFTNSDVNNHSKTVWTWVSIYPRSIQDPHDISQCKNVFRPNLCGPCCIEHMAW